MTPEDFKPDYLVPGTRIGAYVVRGLLGQGGSSSVYEVESAEGHRFALKMCRYSGGAYGTSEWRVDQRYSRSIACLQLLKGRRNVAELYAHDRYPDPLHGHQYLVQELVPRSLLITDWVKRESPTLRKLVGAFVELAEMCGVMASKGICHRDLKPANILVTPEGTPKVIDFESATCPHATPVTRGAASEVPGTGGWQSPELCQAILEESSKKKSKQAFDFLPWGDLFSLGVVFYECLTGEHPFDISLPEDMLLEEVAFETPIHPVRLSTAVPLGLNKVVMKLLKKQPKARYREGAEVAKDLRRLLEKVKDKRWDKPFKQPVPDEEEAPVLSLVPALVPSGTPTLEPVSVNEKGSEGPMPDTPHSRPHSVDTGALADTQDIPKAPSSPHSAKPDAADTDVLLSDEQETAEPREWPESEPAVGTVLDLGKAGAYTLEQRLGRGGMGEVYKARQVGVKGFSQFVAIKRVRPGRKEWEELCFTDEARVLSALHHQNIARVFGFYEYEDHPYLVMEYVEGHSLYALLDLAQKRGHCFSASVACAVMAEVAEALDYAHHVEDEKGRPLHIVHRDVSPTNILIAKTGRVVLLDFGVAQFKDERRIATPIGFTTIKGKAPYVSPEQVKHLPLDARSDLFSVGTILVEMLTGKAPFGWTADWTTLKRIQTVTPEYVASLLPGVSKRLRALCQKLLAFHPDQRFATGREVATELRQHAGLGAGPQSIQAEVERLQARADAKAPPPPAAEAAARALSGVRRARRAVALASALMLAATLALVFWYVPPPAVPIPSSPPPPGPNVSLRPPEESSAPAPAIPPPLANSLVCKPKGEGAAVVAAGPARRRKVVSRSSDLATAEHSAPRVVLADKKTPRTETPPPAERWTDGAVLHVARDSDEAMGTLLNQPAVASNPNRDSNGQVNTLLDQENTKETQRALQAARSQTQALNLELDRYAKAAEEAASVDGGLAALLAENRADLSPFTFFSVHTLHDDGVDLVVKTYRRQYQKLDLAKSAVVFEVTNQGTQPWELDEVRLLVEPDLQSRPFAMRASTHVIASGETARIAVVIPTNDLKTGADADRLVLELWRAGVGIQAKMELIATSDGLLPRRVQ